MPINSVIISLPADFSCGRHFNVTPARVCVCARKWELTPALHCSVVGTTRIEVHTHFISHTSCPPPQTLLRRIYYAAIMHATSATAVSKHVSRSPYQDLHYRPPTATFYRVKTTIIAYSSVYKSAIWSEETGKQNRRKGVHVGLRTFTEFL